MPDENGPLAPPPDDWPDNVGMDEILNNLPIAPGDIQVNPALVNYQHINPAWVKYEYKIDWAEKYKMPESALKFSDIQDPFEFSTTESMEAKKKPDKQVKPTPWDVTEPFDGRISIYGKSTAGTPPEDWKAYEPVGWIHHTEFSLFNRYYFECDGLGTWHTRPGNFTDEDTFICNEEAEQHWEKCEMSGYMTRKGTRVQARGTENQKLLVSKAYRNGHCKKCGVTGDFFSEDDSVKVIKSEKYTWISLYGMKASELFKSCNDCEHVFEKQMVIDRPDLGGTCLCNTCYNTRMNKNIIKAHDSKEYPKPICVSCQTKVTNRTIAWDKEQKISNRLGFVRQFGVEAEIEMDAAGCKKRELNRFDLARAVKTTVGDDFVLIKEDGTLIENGKYSEGGPYSGFEIVSAPADLPTHRERWPLLESMAGLQCLRAWETDTCGFHVHVSRAVLSPLQIGRMMVFCTCKKNQLFVKKIAGRDSKKYNKYINKGYGDCEHPERDEDKYTAINLKHPNTVEFRIFRGTIRAQHIIRNIEFVDALCDFCYPASRSFHEIKDYNYFLRFVEQYRKLWPELYRILVLWEYLKVKPISKKAKKLGVKLVHQGLIEPEIKVGPDKDGKDKKKSAHNEPGEEPPPL